MRILILGALLVVGCTSGGGSPVASDGGVDLAGGGSACALTGNTTPTSTVTNGCALLARDTSGCMAARTAQSLSGAWLRFSCRVTLTRTTAASGDYVALESDGRPDYQSNYFPSSDPCYSAYTPAYPDPNQIAAQSLRLEAPLAPSTTNTKMGLGAVGMAVDGVLIFDNQAAPGDDIFTEAGSFDRCGGHPAPGGVYHFHGEPYAISYDDASLIGVLRDGYFVYGRRDADGSLPALDARGGHVAATADSATPVYHYHLNQQTSTSAGTMGQMQWFLTTGTYEGAPL
jgi:YHYH protein